MNTAEPTNTEPAAPAIFQELQGGDYASLTTITPATFTSLFDGWLLGSLCLLYIRNRAQYENLMTAYRDQGVLARDIQKLERRVLPVVKDNLRSGKRVSKAGFRLNDNGRPDSSRANVLLALEKMGVQLRHDLFADKPTVEGLGPQYGTELSDHIVKHLWASCEERFDFRPPLQNFRAWIEEAGFRNWYHPVRDYLDGLTWDGKPRIDTWLSTYFGAEDSPYTRAVGAIWFLAGVKRVRQPGVKFDELLVLEGGQGGLKSSAIALLAVNPQWFSDSVELGVSEQKMIESTQGVWIYEIAELAGHRRADNEKKKAQLSRTTDRARLAYAHYSTRHLRQSVGIATHNPDVGYLSDPTGARRFWPVAVGVCDIEALQRDRDQLWAEANAREEVGNDAQIRLPRELWPAAAKVQEARATGNAFADVLRDALGNLEGYIVSSEAWRVLGVPVERREVNASKYGKAWKLLGWERHNWRFNGIRTPVYRKGPAPGRRIIVGNLEHRLGERERLGFVYDDEEDDDELFS